MKKISLLLFFVLISTTGFACSCDWGGNFIRTSKRAELVIKAKVIGRNYHFENGKSFSNMDDAVNELLNQKHETDDYTESIDVEVLEVIKGRETRKIIRIFASDGADCRSSVRGFKTNHIYVFAPTSSKYAFYKSTNEKDSDYLLWECSETSVEYKRASDMIHGLIKGKSLRRKPIDFEYNKFVKRISGKN